IVGRGVLPTMVIVGSALLARRLCFSRVFSIVGSLGSVGSVGGCGGGRAVGSQGPRLWVAEAAPPFPLKPALVTGAQPVSLQLGFGFLDVVEGEALGGGRGNDLLGWVGVRRQELPQPGFARLHPRRVALLPGGGGKNLVGVNVRQPQPAHAHQLLRQTPA